MDTASVARVGRRPWRSIRVRTVAVVLVLLALAIGASVLATRAFLLHRLDDRINRRLAAEVAELRTFARTGVDPATGKPFATAAGLMRLAIERAVPDRYETLFSVVDGRASARSAQPAPLRLDTDRALLARVADVHGTETGTIGTARGQVRYVATSVTIAGSSAPRGVYVAAWFRDVDAAEVRSTVGLLALVGSIAAVVSVLLAWLATGRLLAPLRGLAGAARQVDERDLTHRAPVRGADEITDISRTFNSMLDRLETAFDAQRRFTDDAGHELRTPITIVRGHLELLSPDERTRADQRELMLDELDRMSRMVNDLLVLSRAEQSDFLRREPVDLAQLVDELDAKVRTLGDRDWRLPDVAAVEVLLDRHRLTQAILQLAQNAVQHTRDGDRIDIAVTTTPSEVVVSVHDRGPRVAEAERETVFGRFTRGTDAARSGPGVGLGLSIVRAIAETHDGSVAFEAPPGGAGGYVVLRLPRVDATVVKR